MSIIFKDFANSWLQRMPDLVKLNKDFEDKSSKKKWVRSENHQGIISDLEDNSNSSNIKSKVKNQAEEDIIDSEKKLV